MEERLAWEAEAEMEGVGVEDRQRVGVKDRVAQAVGVVLWDWVGEWVPVTVEVRQWEAEAVRVVAGEGVRVPEGQEEGEWLRLRVWVMEGEPEAVVRALRDADWEPLPLLE